MQNGKLNWNYSNLVKYNGGWYYVKNGKIDWSCTTLAQVNNSGAWYYVKNGKIDWTFTGLSKYGNNWYYLEKGKLNWSYSGLAYHYGGWYYVKNGVLDWTYTGITHYNGGIYYVNKGVVDVSRKLSKGIDVSHWQGNIDWAKVKEDGITFAIIRCGHGLGNQMVDRTWVQNVEACIKYGIPYGIYFYSEALTMDEVDAEASNVLSLLSGYSPSLPVFYDMEMGEQLALGASTCSAFAERFCSQIKAAGYNAGLYASVSYYNDLFGSFASKSGYYHWVAEWNSTCSYKGSYQIWQYSSKGSVNGISGNVDLDYFVN